MNKFLMGGFIAAVLLTQCGSAQAGWFDGQKKSAAKTKPNTSVQVQKAAVPAAKPAVTAVAQKAKPAMPQTMPAAADQGKTKFFDVSPTEALTENELKEAKDKREQGRVRLSDEEMKKMKAEMEKLQQGIKSVKEARQAVLVTKSETKPVMIPSIPKLPVLPNTPKSLTAAAPARPAGFKNAAAPVVKPGYKK